jgi:PTS system ascorbate-specific IIA component
MSIGLLIITHSGIGDALVQTAINMLETCPLPTRTLEVRGHCNPDEMKQQAREMVESLDSGEGVLVLTDMYGSTPSNIASTLLKKRRVEVVAGVNLPMLVRIYNYSDLDLQSISEKATSGGTDGIVHCVK